MRRRQPRRSEKYVVSWSWQVIAQSSGYLLSQGFTFWVDLHVRFGAVAACRPDMTARSLPFATAAAPMIGDMLKELFKSDSAGKKSDQQDDDEDSSGMDQSN